MPMEARLTLAGMVAYKPDLFDNLQLPQPPYPEGATEEQIVAAAAAIGLTPAQLRESWEIDKDDFVEFLILETYGMSLCYPDYTFMKKAIGTWSSAHIHEWQRLFDTVFYKYNPMWNKDYNTTESETINKDISDQEYSTGTMNTTGKETDYTNGYDGGTSTEQDPLMTASHTLNWTHSDKRINNNTGTNSGNRTLTTDDDSVRTRTVVEQGNIGVTQVQEMMKAEREVSLFSIEEFIADAFKKQFCLMLW